MYNTHLTKGSQMTANKNMKLIVLACGVFATGIATAAKGDAKTNKTDAPVMVPAPAKPCEIVVSRAVRGDFATTQKEIIAGEQEDSRKSGIATVVKAVTDKYQKAVAEAQSRLDAVKASDADKVAKDKAQLDFDRIQKESADKTKQLEEYGRKLTNNEGGIWASVKAAPGNVYGYMWKNNTWKLAVAKVLVLSGAVAGTYYAYQTFVAQQNDEDEV